MSLLSETPCLGVERIDPNTLFAPDRLDLLIKRRLFLHFLHGDDPESELIYLTHIERRAGAVHPLASYLPKAHKLFKAMRYEGENRDSVPLNKASNLLDGAHRTALTSALNIPLKIARYDTDHTWPRWGLDWFIKNGMADQVPRLLADYTALTGHSEI